VHSVRKNCAIQALSVAVISKSARSYIHNRTHTRDGHSVTFYSTRFNLLTDTFTLKIYSYFHVYVWLQTGYGLVTGFIDHMCTSLGTTGNYSAVANPQTLQIARMPAKPFQACCVFINRPLAAASNSGDSSASRSQVLSSQHPIQNSTLNWLLPGWQPFHTSFLVVSSQDDFLLNWVWVGVTLRLVVLRQWDRLRDKPLDT
jgi:hypothetical protein